MTLPHPKPDPAALTLHLKPATRFAQARFENYQPNAAFPSQAAVCAALKDFVSTAKQKPWFSFRKPQGKGMYLDGGFGVGKTHLLASSFFAAQSMGFNVAMMSFQDLMHLIGALGMPEAVKQLGAYQLLLIDEFELDDPGNTHIANTFLGRVMPAGTHVIATSNTEPGALGNGRFNAEDFVRQIEAIAGRFQSWRVDGPDFRQRGTEWEQPFSALEQKDWMMQQSAICLSYEALDTHLLQIHPGYFASMLSEVTALCITDIPVLLDQGRALRWVHFIDKVYDLGIQFGFTGVALDEIFHETYRNGAFSKKYSRALSRMSELIRESRMTL